MYHRSYHATTGRRPSRDSIGLEGGPDLYEFCDGDPVNEAGPLGLDSDDTSDVRPDYWGAVDTFFATVRTVGRALKTAIDVAASFNPVTWFGTTLNCIKEHYYYGVLSAAAGSVTLLKAAGRLGTLSSPGGHTMERHVG